MVRDRDNHLGSGDRNKQDNPPPKKHTQIPPLPRHGGAGRGQGYKKPGTAKPKSPSRIANKLTAYKSQTDDPKKLKGLVDDALRESGTPDTPVNRLLWEQILSVADGRRGFIGRHVGDRVRSVIHGLDRLHGRTYERQPPPQVDPDAGRVAESAFSFNGEEDLPAEATGLPKTRPDK